MKKITKIFIVSIFAITASLLLITSLHAKSVVEQRDPNFQKSAAWNKVSPELQQLWSAAKTTSDYATKVQCFVVVRSPEPGNEDLLFGVGYATQVFTGNIARGHMALKDLPRVANLYFVRKINLANKY